MDREPRFIPALDTSRDPTFCDYMRERADERRAREARQGKHGQEIAQLERQQAAAWDRAKAQLAAADADPLGPRTLTDSEQRAFDAATADADACRARIRALEQRP